MYITTPSPEGPSAKKAKGNSISEIIEDQSAEMFMGNEKTFTDQNFATDVLKAGTPVLVDFWAEWCGPCRMLAPVVERIAAANEGKVLVGKMNVDENQETPQKYGIQGIPTLILFKNGEPAQQIVGFQSQENIQKIIDEVIEA